MIRRELGNRRLKNYGLSPNLDVNGDGINDDTLDSLIREYKGPNKKADYKPFEENLITMVKSTVILIGITVSALGMWYGTFGCITEFIMKNYIWVTQITLFLVIFLNLFIVLAESQDAARSITPTWLSFIMAFITWLFLNMVMNIGDSWIFVNVPFWPGPVTWWGAILVVCLFVYFIDGQREYWEKNKESSYVEKNKNKSNFYINLELKIIIAVIIIIVIRFIIELIKEKNKLKSRFNILNFFFGLETGGKRNITGVTGHCDPKYNKRMDSELKLRIKNSLWNKIKKRMYS